MPLLSYAPRYILVGVLWTLLVGMLITFGVASNMSDGIIAMSISAVIGVTTLSYSLLRGTLTPPLVEQHAAEVRKRKNEDAGADPMSLLTDDDIRELRAELKDSLRRRMLEGEGEEISSFESLLSDRDQRKRR